MLYKLHFCANCYICSSKHGILHIHKWWAWWLGVHYHLPITIPQPTVKWKPCLVKQTQQLAQWNLAQAGIRTWNSCLTLIWRQVRKVYNLDKMSFKLRFKLEILLFKLIQKRLNYLLFHFSFLLKITLPPHLRIGLSFWSMVY